MICTAHHCSGDQIQEDQIGGACCTNGGKEKVGKPEGKKQPGQPWLRWKDDGDNNIIIMDLNGIHARAWSGLIWLRIQTSGWLL